MAKSKTQATSKRKTIKKPLKKTSSRKKRSLKSGHKVILKIFLVLTVIIGLGSAVTFSYINKKVKTFLKRGNTTNVLMVYSDTEIFPPKKNLSRDAAKKILASFDYREAKTESLATGEFYLTDDQLTVSTREFISPSAQLISPKTETYQFNEDGQMISGHNIQIEPRPIAPLNQANVKSKKFISLEMFPKFVPETVVNTEDERFFKHFGVDPIGILRATTTNILQGRLAQGGSTLNQQLAKNLFFSSEKTFKRKFLEAFAAISLERNLSKEKILELYLNEVYLGQSGATGIYGFPAAAQFFFNKPLEQINLSEAALLAGLIKAPSYYNPTRHYDRAMERRNLVLSKLLDNNIISNAQFLNAKAYQPKISDSPLYKTKAPFFMQALAKNIDELHNLKSLENSALRVQTGLSKYLQNCAEEALYQSFAEITKSYPTLGKRKLEVGLVSMETFSGKIKAWIGGRDYSQNQFDHVSQANRQVGSTIKPFVYLTALDQGLNDYRVATPITILSDEPLSIKQANRRDPWTPKNYDGNFRGAVTLRYALEKSLNIPAVYVSQKVGLNNVAKTIENFDLVEKAPAIPAIALGALETNLLKLTTAYSALANGGLLISPRLFTSLITEDGELIATNSPEEHYVATEQATHVLTNILQGVIERGTGSGIRKLGFTLPAAGKTGTTNDARDAWFVGYTPRLTTGIWLGLDNNNPIGVGGGQVAAPIWARYMTCAQKILPDEGFIKPNGVEFMDIDSETGRRYDSSCAGEPIREIFVSGTEPPSSCSSHNVALAPEDSRNPDNTNRRQGLLDLLFN